MEGRAEGFKGRRTHVSGEKGGKGEGVGRGPCTHVFGLEGGMGDKG